jgi:hypothetical protein
MTRASLLVAIVLLAALACGGEPTSPAVPVSPKAIRIEIGDTVVQSFAAGDTLALFTIQAAEQTDLAIFAQGEAGNFYITISDSVTQELLGAGQIMQDPAPAHLSLSRTDAVTVPAARVLLVQIFHFVPNTSGRVRFFVYRINRSPEVQPSTIAASDTVASETLENLADIDEFLFDAAAGEELIAFIQGEPGVVPGGLSLRVLSPSGLEQLGGASGVGADGELEGHTTGRFVIPTAGKYRLSAGYLGVLETSAENPGTGSYRILLRRINRSPEHVPVVVVPGDTLNGESIDFVGDVDEFQVPVVADSAYNVFVQMGGSSENASLQLTVLSGQEEIAFAASNVGDSALAGRFTGNFTASATGSLKVRVLGPSDRVGLQRGPYRLFVYPIDRSPELAPATLAAGDSVTETIEYPGDIDNFTLSRPSTGVVNLILHRSADRPEWLDLTWAPGGESETVNCFGFFPATSAGCPTGRRTLTGPLPLTIASQLGATTPFRGEYSLVAIAIDTTAEVSPQIVLNQPISEELNPRGDMDIFELNYSAGTLIELVGTGGGVPGNGVNFTFENPSGVFMPGYADEFPITSGRMTLPTSGIYRIRVYGSPTGAVAPYTLEVRTFPSGTESVPGSLSPGDSVSTEAIDQLGDVDDFVITATPGSEVQTFVREGSFRLFADAVVAGSSTLIQAGVHSSTGRVIVPASGKFGVRIYEPRRFSSSLRVSDFGFTGAYSVSVHQINRAPETLGAALTLGMTMNGESMDIEGDVDEFTFAGTAGQQVTGSVSVPFVFDRFVPLNMEIVDPVTGNILGNAASGDGTVATTGSVTLPATRTYLIRMRTVDSTLGKGGYRFRVQ